MNSPGQESSDLKDSNTPPDTHGNGSASDSKRRRPAANGRGVNTLSKEALDKKRDNDRKAQAAIRRRQKEEVASLRMQIDMLNSQQPYLELKAVLEEKNAIQSEHDKLRTALAGFIDTVQPLLTPGIQGTSTFSPHPLSSNPDYSTELAAVAHHNAQAGLANPRSVSLSHSTSSILTSPKTDSYCSFPSSLTRPCSMRPKITPATRAQALLPPQFHTSAKSHLHYHTGVQS